MNHRVAPRELRIWLRRLLLGIALAFGSGPANRDLSAMELSGGVFREKRGYYSSVGSTRPAAGAFRSTGFTSYASRFAQSSSGFNHQSGLIPTYEYPRRVPDMTAATGAFPGEANLQFPAPGASGNEFTAKNYDIRYSTEMPVNNETAWQQAVASTQAWNPQAPNNTETLTLGGLLEGVTYYFAVRAKDHNGNRAEVSNSPSAASQVAGVAISISGADYDFGTFTQVTSSVAAASPLVLNTGNAAAKYSLHITTSTAGTPWTVAASPGADVLAVQAAFHPTRPADGDYGFEDAILMTPQWSQTTADGGRYTIDGSQTGVNVATGTVRNVWMRLLTPLSTSTTDQQDLTVTVTAERQ